MKNVNTIKELNEVLKDNEFVLIDFWAEWCNPCKMLVPMLERIKKDNKKLKFVKVNVEENTSLAQAFGVQSLPTLVMFKNGKDVDKLVGLVSESKVKNMVKEAMS